VALTPDELTRYDRQIRLPGFGTAGQEKLKRAKVLVAGVGGLGSAVCHYLTAAGIGRLVIVDADAVELGNLNRQVLHWEADLGRRKVASATAKLGQINSTIEVAGRDVLIDPESIDGLVKEVDLIVDALDNFEGRRVLNRASLKWKIPYIYGGIHGWTGMVSTFIPGQTPCLECVLPQTSPNETIPVLGATPGVIGCLEVHEAIKYLTGTGQLLTNRLLIFDGLEMHFHDMTLDKNPDCSVCGLRAG